MRRPTTRARQAGFTLVELMVSLLIGSLLVVLILTIFSRMSFALREQQQIVGVQQTLAAARNALEADAKQAGLEISQGFKIAADPTNVYSPVRVVDSSTGPDELGFYYADLSAQAVVQTAGPATSITVDDASGFAANDLVVLSTPDMTSFSNPIDPTNDAKIVTFDACVVQIQAIAGNAITFFEAGNWGNTGNIQCSNTQASKTMLYKFVAHDWRIDPTTPGSGILQMSPTGNLVGLADWQAEAYDFTDLQVATYFFDDDGTDTADPDTDGNRDWYSGALQGAYTQPVLVGNAFIPPIGMTISLVARTDANVEGIATAQTPVLTVTTNTDHNTVGDHDAVTLPSATDPTLMGNRIYRYITFRVDLRNMGVGR